MKTRPILCLCLMCSINAYATTEHNVDIHHNTVNAIVDQGTYTRGLPINPDDITADQQKAPMQLTKAEKHHAVVWRLTDKEEWRYQQLMQNRSQLYYQHLHLSPVWILGLNARTDSERAHFAQLAAKQEAAFVTKNLAWNAAFTQAMRDRTQGLPVIKPFDMRPFSPMNYSPVDWQPHDTLSVYVSTKTLLRGSMTTLMHSLDKHPTLHADIYFIDTNTQTNMEKWAQLNNIAQVYLNQDRIGLHGEKDVTNQSIQPTDLPLYALTRAGKTQRVDASRF